MNMSKFPSITHLLSRFSFIHKRETLFYFLGNVPAHMLHGLSIYRELGGECIVLTKEAQEFCKMKGLKFRMLDEYPEIMDEFDLSRLSKTIDYLNNQQGVIIFFHTFNIIYELKSLTKIMLFHGNGLKARLYLHDHPWRGPILKECDFVLACGPYRETLLMDLGIQPEKMIRTGLTRSDYLIKNSGKVINQDKIHQITGLKNNKIISYLPTWWGDILSVTDLGKEIIKNISDEYILVFRPHPNTPDELIEEYDKLIKKRDNIICLPENKFSDITLMDIILMSDMFILDWSSILTDAILTDKPIMFALSENMKNQLKEIYDPVKEIFEDSVKLTMDNVTRINELLVKSLNEKISPDAWSTVKRRICYGLEGNSTEQLVTFIEDLRIHK